MFTSRWKRWIERPVVCKICSIHSAVSLIWTYETMLLPSMLKKSPPYQACFTLSNSMCHNNAGPMQTRHHMVHVSQNTRGATLAWLASLIQDIFDFFRSDLCAIVFYHLYLSNFTLQPRTHYRREVASRSSSMWYPATFSLSSKSYKVIVHDRCVYLYAGHSMPCGSEVFILRTTWCHAECPSSWDGF